MADFVGEVFLEVLGSARRFDPRRGTAVSWLYGLAAHVASKELRRRDRAAIAERRLSGRQFLQADDFERIEEQVDAAARFRRVYAAMAGLKPEDRQVIELVAVDLLTPAEAAAALGINGVAARVRLSRARRRLRDVLADTDSASQPTPTKREVPA